MSAFQTTASQAILKGQEVWRLTKKVESPGDIFEQDVGALAVAIGPDSDIAKVKVTYYDSVSDSPNKLSQGIVGIDAPFAGRLDALLATTIPGTAKGALKPFPARILFSLDNIVDPNFEIPVTGEEDDSNTFRAETVLDLLSYVADPRGVVPQRRPNKQIDFDNAPPAAGAVTGDINFVVPYFGRRSASILVKAIFAVAPPGLQAYVRGVSINEGKDQSGSGDTVDFVSELATTGAPNSFTGNASFQINANEHGLWDYLVLTVSGLPLPFQFAPGAFRAQFNLSDEG